LQFTSRRSPIYCTHGCVASSQPLATSIGLHVLRELKGNAADASVAVAAALAVLEPCSTGLGGDMFALWYDASKRIVEAVNGSGRAPSKLNIDTVKQSYPSVSGKELEETHLKGIHSVTVPGAAQGWEDVHAKYGSGRLTFMQVLEPAAKLAEEGFPVSTLTAMRWGQQMDSITRWYSAEDIQESKVEMSVDGKGTPPKPGQLFYNPHMAKVLRTLGEKGARDGFYNAFTGRSIVDTIQKHGGVMTMEDLTNHNASTCPTPISVNYRGIDVWQIPPNGQGIAGLIALEGLNALEEHGVVTTSKLINESCHPQQSSEMFHAQIEMMRLGFGDARAYVCDPDFVQQSNGIKGSSEWLLDKVRIAKRALKLFDTKKAVIQGEPSPSSCTVSFQVVDDEGNAMSFVNSNFMGFGTGLTPTGCGFTLQNRGAGFSLDANHPNALAPNKRPYHTIIPAILTHADTGELFATLSNMGGYMQPQGHAQLVVGLVANGLDPQTAIDAPRFCILDGTQDGTVFIEEGICQNTLSKLEQMGHKMVHSVAGHSRDIFGRAQVIVRDKDTGVLCAGSDGRADGCA
ncbi:gamma-glutamyltransferase, partial [Thalassiosira pseudonana CCMP1335]